MWTLQNVSKETGEEIKQNLEFTLKAVQKVGNKLEQETKEPNVEFISNTSNPTKYKKGKYLQHGVNQDIRRLPKGECMNIPESTIRDED